MWPPQFFSPLHPLQIHVFEIAKEHRRWMTAVPLRRVFQPSWATNGKTRSIKRLLTPSATKPLKKIRDRSTFVGDHRAGEHGRHAIVSNRDHFFSSSSMCVTSRYHFTDKQTIPQWTGRNISVCVYSKRSPFNMDSKFSPTMNFNSDMKKKEELSVQLSKPPIPKVETLSSNDLQLDRLQPSDHEFVQENRFEFGQFVAREAVLDEEYWTVAWLRAESHWENRKYDRYDTQNTSERSNVLS